MEPERGPGAQRGERGGSLALTQLSGCGRPIRYERRNKVKCDPDRPTLGTWEAALEAIGDTRVTEG